MDIIVRPGGSNSTPILRDAYHKAQRGDRVIHLDGIYNCEDLTTYNAAIRSNDGVEFLTEDLYGPISHRVTIRRGDNQTSHAVLAPANFDKPEGLNRDQLWRGFVFDGNRPGQTDDWHVGRLEHRHSFDVIGLRYSKWEFCRLKDPCGDGWMVGQTYDGGVRASWPIYNRWADCDGDGKNANRNFLSWISAGYSAIEGSCKITRMGRPDMPGGACYEPDVEGDVVLRCDTSGVFDGNPHDVTFIAQWPGTQIIQCGANIKPSPQLKPWESCFTTARRGGEAIECFMACTPWDA